MFIDKVVNFLREKGIELDDPREKESHQEKTIITHIGECLGLMYEIMKTYGVYSESEYIFAEALANCHDLGKLSPRWGLDRRQPHSAYGARLLLEAREVLRLLSDDDFKWLIYFILKHHSTLARPKLSISSNTLSKIYCRCKKLHKIDREISKRAICGDAEKTMHQLRLLEIFGIFKLADITSAMGIPYNSIIGQYKGLPRHESKEVDVNHIENVLREKCREKGINFDSKKFWIQKQLAQLSPHTFIIAPTGWGKTGLALLKTVISRPTKIFYVLPTITAIRDFYSTLVRAFGDEYVGKYFFFADIDVFSRSEEIEESARIIDLYRYFVPKINVITIDQLMLTMLHVGKYHVRWFNFRDSLFIFDEFHLFTTEMIYVLKAFYEVFAKQYKVRSLFMSASPIGISDERYNTKTPIGELIETIKSTSGEESVKIKVLKEHYNRLARHKIELIHRSESIEEIIDDAILARRKILIILNTVPRAISLYKQLKEKYRTIQQALIHSRFATKDRLVKEGQILKLAKRKDPCIIVSTQVVEVSLDISFDLLITEVAPIPALIQRLGRINRYSATTEKINAYIHIVPSDTPYSPIEMKASREIIYAFSDMLRKGGEGHYFKLLDEYTNNLISLHEQHISEYYNIYESAKKIMCRIATIKAEDKEILGALRGGTYNIMAIPNVYIDNAKQILEEVRALRGKAYHKKKKLISELKKLIIPTPIYIIRQEHGFKRGAKLGIPIVGGIEYKYNKELGLYIRPKNST